MFTKGGKLIIGGQQLAARNLTFCNGGVAEYPHITRKVHTTCARPNYAVPILKIPNNIDAAETTRFSPNRARDISANVILTHYNQSPSVAPIDITADNTTAVMASPAPTTGMHDPHVQSYDCFGAIQLSSVMQSNVPTPFGGMHKFSHLNMPGGQWSQEGKFTSQDLHNSHYTALRSQARSDWTSYDQDATIQQKVYAISRNAPGIRKYCTKVNTDKDKPTSPLSPPTKKEQLKKAFKEYGSTIIVFHVAMSLASLGACYALVSGGIDVLAILNTLGISSTTLSNNIAAGASTFVIAYAIHKIFAPIRISITLGAAPFIVRYLRSKGFLKPPSIIKEK